MFDGHGVNGHQVSAFASGTMLDFVKNSPLFKEIHDPSGEPNTDQEISKAIRCCFKYTQDKVRNCYHEFLLDRKKKEMAKEKYDQMVKVREELNKKKAEIEQIYENRHVPR